MITDPKEQKEFFNAPETVTTPAEFKTWFQDTFIKKDQAAEDPVVRGKVSGSLLGSEMTNFYRTAKEAGIEFDAEEKKAIVKNEDLFSLTLKKMQGTYVNQIEELKKKEGHGGDEKLKAMEEALAKKDGKIKEIESAWAATASTLEETKKQGEATLRNFKITTLLTEAEKGVKLKQKMTEAERMGWESAKATKLKYDLTEKGDAIEPFNANNERIPSKNKAGTFVGITEALQDLANELGLAEINPHGGKPATQGSSWGSGQHQASAEPTGKTILRGGKPVKV